jgi:hypothetical protein
MFLCCVIYQWRENFNGIFYRKHVVILYKEEENEKMLCNSDTKNERKGKLYVYVVVQMYRPITIGLCEYLLDYVSRININIKDSIFILVF